MNPIGAEEKTLDWRIETVGETSSTNDLVSARAREGEPGGLVIRAISQTRGRGRRGRSWFSPPGSGLYFSALLRPDGKTEISSLLTLLLGVAAAEGLAEAASLRVGLKWPNDLRVNGKKIGGILCEYLEPPDQPPAVVAGLGVNITTSEADFPPELYESASSILLSGGRVPDAEPLLRLILRRIAFWYKEYESNGFGAIRDQWLRICDNLGEETSVRVLDETFSGINNGIDEAGRLLLEKADGSTQRITSGEVELP
ncbi:MAG: biotin--[acetyl-CoA-carboxylase] ligase [Nitrospinae bacterium]|nr:biotin--[acetyl-CoA-carboxylase] ligase [Nitrospinota bacterium]